ncbi:MFS-type transporter 1 [Cladobotryum mycophilum]|uniref:MFS-type transporter 1 n=1 Tax=Cladobotryum mycophilum TaxID=491253 RepID=A0ABR0SVN2_9HYPO
MSTQTQTVLVPAHEHIPLETHHHPRPSLEFLDRPAQNASNPYSLLRKSAVITQLAGVNLAISAINGLVVVGLPSITADLHLSHSLSFWPVSVFSLATASTLLLAGSVADALGPRAVDLIGCFASGAFMIGAGAARKGTDLVAIRAIQGVAFSLHLAASVAIVSQVFPRGRGRNFAFSCLGLSQPLGFSFGLVLGGVLEDTIGWRAGWFLYGGLTLLLSTIGLWALPKDKVIRTAGGILRQLKDKIDIVGALLASAFMAMLSYLLAIISTDVYKIRDSESIVLLCLSAVALPSFIAWVHRQVRIGQPALIPNSLWKNSSFSTICATIALSFAVINSLELFASLFFQQVQHLSALQASIRILPSMVVGIILNFSMGLFVHRIPALWIVAISSAVCAVSPLLMALIQPQWPYWSNAFVAQLLQPVSTDALFTVGLLIITEVFPEDTQALAGAVFNTAAQLGSALGVAVIQVVSTLITKENARLGESQALLEGFKASFWTMFGFMMLCGLLGVIGLRKTGRVGLKQELDDIKEDG